METTTTPTTTPETDDLDKLIRRMNNLELAGFEWNHATHGFDWVSGPDAWAELEAVRHAVDTHPEMIADRIAEDRAIARAERRS